jgi:hypothetical protein
MLFVYSQNKKGTVEEYARNFRSQWDTVEAFSGSPGVHKGMIDAMLCDPTRVTDMDNPTEAESQKAREDVSEAIKAALLDSGMDKWSYGQLIDKLANNYLLSTDQYPDMFEKAQRILGNYHVPKNSLPFKARASKGIAFIQQGQGWSGGQAAGQGNRAG